MPNIPSSLQCDEAVGTEKKDMKTIAIAPNGQYYLTDGHHTFNAFWQMKDGGKQFKVNVVVAKGYRQAITDVSHYLINMKSDNVGGSGKTTKEMGQFTAFNEKGLNKLFNAKKGKVTYMLKYKNSL